MVMKEEEEEIEDDDICWEWSDDKGKHECDLPLAHLILDTPHHCPCGYEWFEWNDAA
jgi:hypothetical protein